jgi:hypothetical protein
MWELWYCGNKEKRIKPYSYIQSIDLKKEYRVQWSRVRGFMEAIQKEHGEVEEKEIANLSAVKRDELFQKSFTLLIQRLKGINGLHGRPDQLKIGTIYGMIKEKEKREKEQEEKKEEEKKEEERKGEEPQETKEEEKREESQREESGNGVENENERSGRKRKPMRKNEAKKARKTLVQTTLI